MKWKLPLIAFAILIAAVGGAQDIGLLLGLSDKDGKSSTVWIGQQGVATFARRAGDGYWLWKQKGFMHIEPDDFFRTSSRATVTVTDVEGKAYEIKGEVGEPRVDLQVMYVAPRGIGLLRTTNSLTGGQPVQEIRGGLTLGGDDAQAAYLRRLPMLFRHHDWADLEVELEIGAVFDEGTVEKFMDGAKSLGEQVSPSNWTLQRDRGAWMLRGLIYWSRGAGARGKSHEYTVGSFDDKSLGSVAVNGPKWSRIRSEYPDAIDYTVSPDGKMTVIITPTDVFVHKSSGSSLQKRLQRVRVPADRVVMTQWLSGSEVRKVGEAVTKIKR